MAIAGKSKSQFGKFHRAVKKGGRKMQSSPKASKRASRGKTRY